MIADLVTLFDFTADKVYVDRWLIVFVAIIVAVLVWHRVWGRRL